jgi:hypothetical protein
MVCIRGKWAGLNPIQVKISLNPLHSCSIPLEVRLTEQTLKDTLVLWSCSSPPRNINPQHPLRARTNCSEFSHGNAKYHRAKFSYQRGIMMKTPHFKWSLSEMVLSLSLGKHLNERVLTSGTRYLLVKKQSIQIITSCNIRSPSMDGIMVKRAHSVKSVQASTGSLHPRMMCYALTPKHPLGAKEPKKHRYDLPYPYRSRYVILWYATINQVSKYSY